MRQVVLDTETTGLSHAQGHRIIEIGCVELSHRRLTGKTFHCYLNPGRAVDAGAMQVHGISTEFLTDKPKFSSIANDFKKFIEGAELIIHNAAFDVGFIQNEFVLLKEIAWKDLENQCSILDTLKMARKKHPGQRNTLDALCKRYKINNQHREKHGALLDAYILADVYLAMTGGQNDLSLEETALPRSPMKEMLSSLNTPVSPSLAGYCVSQEEQSAHDSFLKQIESGYGVKPLWEESKS